MELKDLNDVKNLTEEKEVSLFNEVEAKGMEDIKNQINEYLEKGLNKNVDAEKNDVTRSITISENKKISPKKESTYEKEIDEPSIKNSVENIKETIRESIMLDIGKMAFQKFSKTKIGKKIIKAIEKPLNNIVELAKKAGKLVFDAGKTIVKRYLPIK